MAFTNRRKNKKTKSKDESLTQLISKEEKTNPNNPHYDTFEEYVDQMNNNNNDDSSPSSSGTLTLKVSAVEIPSATLTKSSGQSSILSPIVSAPEDNVTSPLAYINPIHSVPVTPTKGNRLTPKSKSTSIPTSPPPPNGYVIIYLSSLHIDNIYKYKYKYKYK